MNSWPIAMGAIGGAAGLAAWGAFHPASQLFGRTIRHTGQKSAIALTFDDGPNPAVTPKLLDLLDRYRVRATFFLIGQYVRARPELAAEVVRRGHSIGNHTDTHPILVWASPRRTVEELQSCQEALARATGRSSVWMRPPYGFRGPQSAAAVREAGLRDVVMWSVQGNDWKLPAGPLIERLQRVRGGDIVLLHDGAPPASGGLGADRHATLAALEHWLPRWKDAGLELVTLEDLRASC